MCMTSQKTSSNGLCRHHDSHNVDCTAEMLPQDKEDCDTKQDKEPNEDKEPRKAGAGFLIILFYYFQDALLLHVDTGGVLHCQYLTRVVYLYLMQKKTEERDKISLFWKRIERLS